MAKLEFTLSEIINILELNMQYLPEQIKSINKKNNHLSVRINPAKLFPNFEVLVSIKCFERDILMIELESKAPIKILMKFMIGFLIKVPNYYELDIQGNTIKMNLNNIISQKNQGIKIMSVIEENGIFKVEIELRKSKQI